MKFNLFVYGINVLEIFPEKILEKTTFLGYCPKSFLEFSLNSSRFSIMFQKMVISQEKDRQKSIGGVFTERYESYFMNDKLWNLSHFVKKIVVK